MSELSEKIADFHVRLGKLETLVHVPKLKKNDSKLEKNIELLLSFLALVFCFLGFGIPNHYYQLLFALLIVLCLYHKSTFPWPTCFCEWVLLVINVLLVCMLLKLIIGGGQPRPFSWLAYPTFEGGVTSFKFGWQSTSAAEWELPLTVIQSFFLIITMFGTLIGLNLLSGMTSFVLVTLALPSLVDFNWTWAMPGMISTLACFYLQSE